MAGATAVAVDNQPNVDADDVESGSSYIDDILPILVKPPSQLIRTIASRDNTIQRERSKRKLAEEKVAKAEEELKRTRHEMHRDRRVSLDLIEDRKREGVEMMEAANNMMEEYQCGGMDT